MKLLIGIYALVFLLSTMPILAAELEPALQSELATAANSHNISVIVKLYNPHDIQALDQQLHVQRATLADRHRHVINTLHRNAEETQRPVLDRLDRMKALGQVMGYTAYWIENLIVVYGNAEAIEALAADPAVEAIGYNFQAVLIDPVVRGPVRGYHPDRLDNETVLVGQRATGATRVNHELGITGHGRLIAGMDTGVDGAHPALHDRWRGMTHPHSQCWHDVLGTSDTPSDSWGHGTHTMGTMTGRVITGSDTVTLGAAPDAEWISCNAIGQNVGTPLDQDILDGFQWLADPDGDSTTVDDMPDVIQNSWGVYNNIGGDPHYTTCFSDWNTVVTNCEAAGTVVIFSAGNEGSAAQSLRSPAKFQLNPTQIFSVGAVDLSSDSVAPYPIASFSSRGPSGCGPDDTAVKPEIVAPGVHVYSSYPGNSYQFMDGTSMAGPHISGIVALLREACPNCDPQTIKEALINTAIRTGYVTPPDTENNTYGYGFVDAYEAVLSLGSLGRVDGYVTLANGDPLRNVQVQAVSIPRSVQTNPLGYYDLVIAQAGTYTMRYTKFGYVTVTRNNVQVVAGDTTHENVTMTPAAGGILAGTVFLQNGLPLQNASVSFPGTPVDTFITDVNGRFIVNLPADTYAVHISLRFNTPPPRVFTLDTTLVVQMGDTTHTVLTMQVSLVDPSPADAYGYMAYDRYDRDLPCPYNWLELNPASGGHGRPFTYSGGDAADFFATPFPLFFYGWEAETLTVNCNGWMLPGVHTEAGRVNTRIPQDSAADPPGIIAPLWNDFTNGNGGLQFVQFDTASGRWVFEFLNQRLLPNNLSCTWQVQFLDPAFYPTRTGDCEMHFLYGPLPTEISGSTVGIENPAENTGIQVLHDTLSPWSWPVDNGGAIRFTTGHTTQHGSVTVALNLNPPPPDGTPLTLHLGGRTVTTTTPNPLVLDSVPSGLASGVVSLNGYQRARADQAVIHANQMNTVYMDAWRLDQVRNLSFGQMNGAVTLRWSIPASLEYASNPGVTFTIYRNDTLLTHLLTDTSFTDLPLPNHATVFYQVGVQYGFDEMRSAPVVVTIDLAVSPIVSTLPTSYQLYPNYPNPFNPDTRIRLDVPLNAAGRLEIYDLEGRLVRTLYSGMLSAGRYQYSWNAEDEHGRSVASGLYFCRFASPTYTATQKMMLIK